MTIEMFLLLITTGFPAGIRVNAIDRSFIATGKNGKKI